MGTMLRKYSVQLVKDSSKVYDVDKICDSSSKAKKLIYEFMNQLNSHNEKFGVVALDAQNRIIGIHIISEGTLTQASVYFREVAVRLLLNNANSCIIFHNHPGGSKRFSIADIETTRKLKQSLEMLEIKVVDHVLYTEENEEAVSMAENGLI
jgi:DNA repair protein RadC